ncbi:hypothetical protein [Promicromonospora panici]|uniref:hypothetical protein n=1 Tax=Promicromonospora panici TaxID=2219658 RepID=UPI001F5DCE8D|nr:hypothetical protein [Promicromonospora panici]
MSSPPASWAEIVLPAEASSDVDQFARTPYAAGFVREATEFILTTVHVLWGKSPADRIGELTAFAEWMWDRDLTRSQASWRLSDHYPLWLEFVTG